MADEPRWCPGVKNLTQQHMSVTSGFYTRRNRGVRKLDNICKECRKAHTRRWRQENPDKVAQYDRRYRERRGDEIRDYQREYYRIVYGKGAWTWKKYRTDEQDVRLPAAPFKDWIHQVIVPLLASREEIQAAASRGGGEAMGLITWTGLADRIDMDPKTLYGYTTGRSQTVPREVVDRLGILFGNMSLADELYPDQISEAV